MDRDAEKNKKAKRSAANARYYKAHRDELLEKAKSRVRTCTPQTAEQRRSKHNKQELEDLHSNLHPDLKPITQTLMKLNLSPKLYKHEVRIMSELLMIISADWEFNGSKAETSPEVPIE